ncbi:MAG: hypothetical protein SFV21_15375 [Rhodospirillaceae bacterium]|nr:hypothetical protein [Rhodospirillaceae bacterium]
MANFIGDIALVLSIALFCTGLIVWDTAQRPAAVLSRVAAVVMIVGGLSMSVCVAYYWLTYRFAGQFETAYPVDMRGGMGGMGQDGMMWQMMRGGMRDGTGDGDMMQGGMGRDEPAPASPAAAPATDAEHEQHHPESVEGSQPPGQEEATAPLIDPAERERLEQDPGRHPM